MEKNQDAKEYKKVLEKIVQLTANLNKLIEENKKLAERLIIAKAESEEIATKYEKKCEEMQQLSLNLSTYFNEDQIKALKVTNSKGSRWDAETCEIAISLRYRIGLTNYEEVRKLVPLPSSTTLFRHIRPLEYSPGIHDAVIDYMKIIYCHFPAIERRGILLVDRMSLVPGENLDKFGERQGYDTLKGDKNILASEGLAILFCGTVRRYKFVISHHYTEKSVNGEQLKNVLIDCIKKLWNVGVIVDGICSDMGPENTSMFKAFGVQFIIKNDSVSIPHPCDASQKLFLFADTSHLKKNVSNNFKNQKKIKIPHEFVVKKNLSSEVASFSDILKIYNMQKKFTYLPARKLTKEIVAPSNYQKMRVKTHTRLFSSDVSTSLEFILDNDAEDVEKFLTMGIGEFVDDLKLNPTAFFLKMMDKWSHFMQNRSKPITLTDDKQVKEVQIMLSEFYRFFKDIRFESGNLPCLTGARLSTKAISELINYYKEIGIEKFTPGWFTSDAIENLFSCIRRVRPLPSCKDFSQQIRTEIIKRVTEITLHTSYDQDDSFEFNQLSFLEYLKTVKNDSKSTEQISDEILEKIEELNESIINKTLNVDDPSCFHNNLEINTFYYVCGFLVKKTLKKSTCESCENIMVDANPIPHQFNKLVRLRKQEHNYNYTEPSDMIFQFLLKLENTFLQIYQNLDCSNDSFKKIFIDTAMNVISLPGEHCENVTKLLVENFVNLRIYMTCEKRDRARRSKHSSHTMR